MGIFYYGLPDSQDEIYATANEIYVAISIMFKLYEH